MRSHYESDAIAEVSGMTVVGSAIGSFSAAGIAEHDSGLEVLTLEDYVGGVYTGH